MGTGRACTYERARVGTHARFVPHAATVGARGHGGQHVLPHYTALPARRQCQPSASAVGGFGGKFVVVRLFRALATLLSDCEKGRGRRGRCLVGEWRLAWIGVGGTWRVNSRATPVSPRSSPLPTDHVRAFPKRELRGSPKTTRTVITVAGR